MKYSVIIFLLVALTGCFSESSVSPPEVTEIRSSDVQVAVFWDDSDTSDNDSDKDIAVYIGTREFDVDNYSAADASVHSGSTSPLIIEGLEPDTTYYLATVARQGEQESNPTKFQTIETYPEFRAIGGINDTGVNFCVSEDQTLIECDDELHQGQEGVQGRDYMERTEELEKLGDGPAGFDFTRVDEYGNFLPDDAQTWSCVRDNVSGLLWEVKVDMMNPEYSVHGINSRYTWFSDDMSTNMGWAGQYSASEIRCDEALEACNTQSFVQYMNDINYCGVSDWRLPAVAELISVIDYGEEVRGIGNSPEDDYPHSEIPQGFPADYFPFRDTGFGWEFHTFETSAVFPDSAVQATLFGGTTILWKEVGKPVIAVADVKHEPFEYGASACTGSALSSLPEGRFHKTTSGTVIDDFADLEWQQCFAGQTADGGNCKGDVEQMTWHEALFTANQEAGWRLPTIKELVSTFDFSCEADTSEQAYFPLPAENQSVWSSTPVVWNEDSRGHFNTVETRAGLIQWVDSMNDGLLRLVRDIE